MTLSESVIQHEGLRAEPYKDTVGIWTLGVGRCLERNPLSGAEWKALLDGGLITVSLASPGSTLLLENDLTASAASCAKMFWFWAALDQGRRDVLTEMAFQLGSEGLRKFSRMTTFLAAKNYQAAAQAGLDSLWAKETPARAQELMKRLETGA